MVIQLDCFVALAMIFCDTSAIAKLYLVEKETRAMRARLEAEDQVLISELVRAELMSVFHRQLRERNDLLRGIQSPQIF